MHNKTQLQAKQCKILIRIFTIISFNATEDRKLIFKSCEEISRAKKE